MENEPPIIVAIDGRCGSGKTYFAELIKKLFPCNVCHMDDFYLPFEKRQENWMEIPGANMDLNRFYTEILKPIRAGRPVIYQSYNCKKDTMEEGISLPIRKLTIVEGSYSHHPLLAKEYDLKIFLTCSGEEQRKRLQFREGSRVSAFEKQWIPLEEKYLQCYEIEKKSHFVVDTSDFL
ncbi:MAG: uridine kinase [Lachnospiraceae bacterium]|nr:uridine kinase [Lachnospiraceae bacterium]